MFVSSRVLGAARTGMLALLVAGVGACDQATPTSVRTPEGRSGLFLEFDATTLAVGQSGTLLAGRKDAAGVVRSAAAAWHSADPSVVAAGPNGALVGRGAGSTTVWARVGSDSVSALVTVLPTEVPTPARAADRIGGVAGAPGATQAAGSVAVPRWVAISSGASSMLVGQSQKFAARAWDSAGKEIVPTPAMTWTSSQPTLVTVDAATGLVTVLKPAQSAITARPVGYPNGPYGVMVVTAKAAAPVTGTTASVAVSPAKVSVKVGGSSQLVAAARDAAGATLSGRKFTWTSNNPKVASVSDVGLVRAIAVGTAVITIACDGKAATANVLVSDAVTSTPTSTASVPLTAARLEVDPHAVTLAAGTSSRLTFHVSTSTGVPVEGRAASWSSLTPEIATVDSTGLIAAIKGGSARVVAEVEGVADTADVTVTEPLRVEPTTPVEATPAPISVAGSVALTVVRFDGKSGVVKVSNGIPLPPGTLTERTVNQLHVFVDGVEQHIFAKPLAGRHADGSLRSVLVQFDYDVPRTGSVAAYFTIGGDRTDDVAEREAEPAPAAAALPTSAEYLLSTKLSGSLMYAAGTPAATPLIAQYEADYARISDIDWKNCGVKWDCGRTAGYDRGFILYQQWMRTGDPKYWHHATYTVDDYVKKYVTPAAGPAPWWSNSEGVALAYLLTGDEKSRTQLRKMAEVLAWMTAPIQSTGLGRNPNIGDDRQRAKALLAMLDARLIDVATPQQGYAVSSIYSKHLGASTLDEGVTLVLGTQQANGAFGGTYYLGGQKNFMTGMLLTALIRYYDEVRQDPRIVTAVKRNIDYMWANDWDETLQGFKYVSKDSTQEFPRGQTKPEPGLNGLTVPAFAWYYSLTGDANVREMVDRQLAALTATERKWWEASGKTFDQGFYRAFNVWAWRAAR
jgi:uncharacterized protein YjdB